jgi:hypothetical protein
MWMSLEVEMVKADEVCLGGCKERVFAGKMEE